MSNILAAASGNWSDPATWVGGVLPGSADIAYANGKTVEVNQDITVTNLSNAPGTGITGGGSFVVSTSLAAGQTRTINITGILNSGSGGGGVLVISAADGTVQLNVNEISSTGINTGANNTVIINGAGVTVNSPAKLTGGGNNSGPALAVNAGTAKFGNVIGSNPSGRAVYINGGTLTVGKVDSTTSGTGIDQAGGTLITGDVTGSSGWSTPGIACSGGNLDCGTVYCGSSSGGSPGITITNAPQVTAKGAVGALNVAIYLNNSTGNALLSVNGPVIAGSRPAIQSDVKNYIRIKGPMKHGVDNSAPIQAPAWMVYSNQPVSWTVKDDGNYPYTGNDVIITNEAASAGLPSVDDVRAGVSIGTTGQLIGKLQVPPADSVASGVPVDQTVGTAAVKLSQIADIVGDQIAGALTTG